MRQIGSVVFWLFVVISSIPLTAIAFVIWLVTMPFDKRRVVLHRFTCFWASLYTWTNPAWPVTITGREHIEAGRTYVLVANHLSLLDILVLFRLFKDFKWVSKAEIFKVPGVGWNMRWNKYIPLKRGERESIAEMMAASEETLRSGSSIMIFPEGTRSKTGELKDFKRGAFDMARDTDCAIVVEDVNASLRHSEIRVTVAGPRLVATVKDLGSTNGTWVNGERVTSQRLTNGDRLTVGRTSFVYRSGRR